jgi:hypothetical protein
MKRCKLSGFHAVGVASGRFACAPTAGASCRGTVTDRSGAMIAGAEVARR